ncbi:MAG: hypothetical protein GY715_04000 [Planctomycetes bacterium]|nr:hypothetical protein [Planctomycetota bacterium]
MKSQTSRPSHRPDQRYSGVYQQQGRMITDADWNEQVEVGKTQLHQALRDALAGGAPRDEGFIRAVDPDSGVATLGWGRVYAEGVGAEVRVDPDADGVTKAFEYEKQADFPDPPARDDTGATWFVDIWDRHVVSLQDGHLRDPALHGADTCTRTQRLAQVKRCASKDEFDERIARCPIGTAKLSLALHDGATVFDECEPCAADVPIEHTIGNYLFRVEVHQVIGLPWSPDEIVLKWSSENAAEQHPIDEKPDDFEGSWIYEYFTETSEKHLGVHAPGHESDLEVRDLVDSLIGAPSDVFVRRWDGYCRLTRNGGAWTMVEGRDKGTPLDSAIGGGSHGFLALDALSTTTPKLDIRLERLHLVLDLADDTVFVAGDYWNAVVRERADDGSVGGEDERVRLVSNTPVGIRHHYLLIGTRDDGGDLIVEKGRRRRGLRFPPLTDLTAGDVGYKVKHDCPNGAVEETDDTVEKTLDHVVKRLCGLSAEHVSYEVKGKCPSGAVAESDDTVKLVLDKVVARLCNLAALHVKYEPGACPDLEEAKSVQDAIDTLCSRPSNETDLCAAFLALFGRGVICGLIPRIIRPVAGLQFTVEVTPGKVIDGRGCFRQVEDELTEEFVVANPGSGFTIKLDELDELKVDYASVVSRLSAPSGPAREERIPSTNFRFERLPEGEVDPTYLVRILEREKEEGRTVTFDNEAKARDWVMLNTGMVADSAFADAVLLEAFRRHATEEKGVGEQCLYLTVSETGTFGLKLDDCPKSPLYDVKGNVGNEFPGAYIPKLSARGCDQAEHQAWAPYQLFYRHSCLKANDGSVCLGTVHYTEGSAWVCPMKREDLLFTPAVVNAMRKLEGMHEILPGFWDSWSAVFSEHCMSVRKRCK